MRLPVNKKLFSHYRSKISKFKIIIKEQNEIINNPENKSINKKHKFIDNIIKQSIISYVKSNKDI